MNKIHTSFLIENRGGRWPNEIATEKSCSLSNKTFAELITTQIVEKKLPSLLAIRMQENSTDFYDGTCCFQQYYVEDFSAEESNCKIYFFAMESLQGSFRFICSSDQLQNRPELKNYLSAYSGDLQAQRQVFQVFQRPEGYDNLHDVINKRDAHFWLRKSAAQEGYFALCKKERVLSQSTERMQESTKNLFRKKKKEVMKVEKNLDQQVQTSRLNRIYTFGMNCNYGSYGEIGIVQSKSIFEEIAIAGYAPAQVVLHDILFDLDENSFEAKSWLAKSRSNLFLLQNQSLHFSKFSLEEKEALQSQATELTLYAKAVKGNRKAQKDLASLEGDFLSSKEKEYWEKEARKA